MRITEQGQIIIPKHLRDRFGMNTNVEVEITPTEQGLLIRKRDNGKHPVDGVYGILNCGDTDSYLGEMRGRLAQPQFADEENVQC